MNKIWKKLAVLNYSYRFYLEAALLVKTYSNTHKNLVETLMTFHFYQIIPAENAAQTYSFFLEYLWCVPLTITKMNPVEVHCSSG